MRRDIRSDLTLTTAPASLPLTLDQVKAQCRVDTGDDDTKLTDLIQTAVDYIDPSGFGWLGAALMSQQWTLTLDQFPRGLYSGSDFPGPGYWISGRWQQCRAQQIELPFPPLITLDEVKYYDVNGVQQTLASSTYQVAGIGAWRRARLAPAPGTNWPDVQFDRLAAVSIKFTCGHPTAAGIPASVRHALLLLISHWYENRSDVIAEPGRVQAIELPRATDALLANYRIHY